MKVLELNRHSSKLPFFLFVAFWVLTYKNLKDYFVIENIQIIAIIAYILISKLSCIKRINYFFILLSMCFVLLYQLYHVKSFLFISCVIISIEFLSFVFGRLHINSYILLFICSPIFIFFNKVLGVPIKLQLTQFSTFLLNILNPSISSSGNLIHINGTQFFVDDACAGLNMLISALIFTVFIIEIFRSTKKKEINMFLLLILYITTILLNILSNVFRIVLLVQFNIPPDNPLHYYIGIICFIIYNIIPIYFLTKFVYNYYSAEIIYKISENKLKINRYVIVLCLFVANTILFFINPNKNLDYSHNHYNLHLDNATSNSMLDYGVKKITLGNLLIYEKPMYDFYSSEHNPLFCWSGSGYAIKNIKEIKVNNKFIYFGNMYKENKTIYTTWFYKSKHNITNSQLEWRLANIKNNENYSLINVSSNDKNELLKWLNNNI